MKLSVILIFVVSAFAACASAQQDPQQLVSQVDKLTALVEQQQKQIEQLQKSQADLLQELRAQRAPAAADAPGMADTAAAGIQPSTASPEAGAARVSAYDAPKERGIA